MRKTDKQLWRFAVDRGGTFTDVIGVAPGGQVETAKVLSESPEYPDAGIEGIRRLLDIRPEGPLPSDRIEWIRMGTTVATNALLERKGMPTGLLITRGFKDLLEIGTQDRPDIFALAISKPKLLYCAVAEVRQRQDAEGRAVEPLDMESLRQGLAQLKEQGARSVAIVFLFSWKNPTDEQTARAEAQRFGFEHICTSHESLSIIQAVPRGRTTLVDAYLSPIVIRYADSIARWTGEVPVYFMSSSGNLLPAGSFTGKDAILSGPAGGMVATAAIARSTRSRAVIGFDMGGTSTDVCRYSGRLERVMNVETAGVRFTAPMLHVETVAAGGGSILAYDGRKLTVGPESAGADPGPACYGLGGPATVTDANLVLGRIQPDYFPRIFGPGRDAPLDIRAARERLNDILETVTEEKTEKRMTIEQLALGFLKIANESMSRPIKDLSVARGHDPREHALVTFGGAGAQHACGIARALGIKTVFVPPHAGLLSAFGILCQSRSRIHVETTLMPLKNKSLTRIRIRALQLADEMEKLLKREGLLPEDALLERIYELDVRTPGTDMPISLPLLEKLEDIQQIFIEHHQAHYGFVPAETSLEVVNLRVEVSEEQAPPPLPDVSADRSQEDLGPEVVVPVWLNDRGPVVTPVYLKDKLRPGARLEGPALIMEDHSTVVVEPDCWFVLETNGILRIEVEAAMEEKQIMECDPVMLEVFHHLFMGVAEQMGHVLQRTAHSVNIRERLDFSCAVFDSVGRLVANAAHIPVHLGAMSETVKELIDSVGDDMRPGDFYCTNDPYAGGSHLPDLTVMAPVFRQGKAMFYLAARGHHTDIGGRSPGSMPPDAQTLEEEGVVMRNLLISRGEKFLEEKVRAALSQGPFPARNLAERFSDMRSQIAAAKRGITEIESLCEKYGEPMVAAYMGYIRADVRYAMAQALLELLDGQDECNFSFQDTMDNGHPIKVNISLGRDLHGQPTATVNFTGTGGCLPGNLNAPKAVVRSAVLYVLRTMIHRSIPLNDGCIEKVKIIVPPGSLLNPLAGSAVSAGNVETSQRIVDVLYGALGLAAASQGTMNNLLFGRPGGQGSQYYETIAGGSGAIQGADGAHAVQVHMTNTRITDPEVLESRFPEVRLEKFEIRKNSGGIGRWTGGDGVVRVFRFLEPREVTVISERRVCEPFGLFGGSPGQHGENLIIRANGHVDCLGGRYHGLINAGDQLEIRTPGGGGFGKPSDRIDH